MDFQSIKEQIAGLSLYDVKAAVRKAQNVVMNYTEMEAKVREATNNEPWGASSTLMQEIANGTYNYQLLNEIMPMIYKRFTEKSAEEWRQIYKALQLLEFLVKNGSEQVIDDARSHISTIKMLRQFHYIDNNGKDQGINVRNRAKELGELLSDVDRIRAERKKARSTKSKYSGIEGGGFSSGGFGGSSSRYGGFGSDSTEYGGYSGNQVYGDGGGFENPSRGRGYNDEGSGSYGGSSGRQKFEEYDEYDEGAAPNTSRTSTSNVRRHQPTSSTSTIASKTAAPPKKVEKAPAVDLLFDNDSAGTSTSNGKQTSSVVKNPLDDFDDFTSASAKADDDDFADFQAAPPPPASNSNILSLNARLSALPPPSGGPAASFSSSTTIAAPQPRSSQQAANITGLVGMTTPNIAKSAYSPPPVNDSLASLGSLSLSSAPAPSTNTSYQPQQPNYFTSVPSLPGSSSILTPQNKSGISAPSTPSANKSSTTTTKSTGDAFGSIWSSVAASSIKKPASTEPKTSTGQASLAEMAKSRAQTGLWATPSTQKSTNNSNFGSFGGISASGGQKKSGNDLDDLLG